MIGWRILKEGQRIPRYTRAEMEAVWSEQSKCEKMLEVEILACEALA